MNDGLTPYQTMIVKYLEAYYKADADVVIRRLHEKARYADIAEFIGCSRMTLLSLCKKLGIEEPPTRLSHQGTYPNATDFFKQFDNAQAAVIECRDKLDLNVKQTMKKLGVSYATVCRHTPEYLKFI